MKNRVHDLYALERLAGGDTAIHRLHPAAKLLAAAMFVVTVVSYDRFCLFRLVPFIFYPAILMAVSETPYLMLLKRFLVALPFCLFAGLSALFLEGGVLALLTLVFRAYLCVMAVLLLAAVTPLWELTNSLRRMRLPDVFVVMFEMTYRYLGVLADEAHSMYTAYSLRSPNAKGIALRDMGGFAGQLLLRAFERAGQIYEAMRCRGYSLGSSFMSERRAFGKADILYLAIVCAFCLALRFGFGGF